MALDNVKDLCLLDIAYNILKDKKEAINIYDLIDQSAQIKGISTYDVETLTQLYIDITLSGKFVYVGDDKWALKEGNLEYWDKDGYAFTQTDVEEEFDDDDLDFTEFNLDSIEEDEELDDEEDEEDEELDEDLKEEKEYLDVGLQIDSTDDDFDEDVDLDLDDDDLYDEDDYNEIMDDYEDMYDK